MQCHGMGNVRELCSALNSDSFIPQQYVHATTGFAARLRDQYDHYYLTITYYRRDYLPPHLNCKTQSLEQLLPTASKTKERIKRMVKLTRIEVGLYQ